MPANTVKVNRTTKWGNPFVPEKEEPIQPGQIVEDKRHTFVLYRAHALNNPDLILTVPSGKNLARWSAKPNSEEKVSSR